MKKISNPLTIIGMFAGVAEVFATSVLPFIPSDLQHIFIWYVMGFPAFLVITFFITLNFNSKALYAPSDFDDEKNFMLLRNAAIQLEQIKSDDPENATKVQLVQENIGQVLQRSATKEMQILRILMNSNGLSAKAISEKAGTSLIYTKQILNSLIKKEMVEKKEISADLREHKIRMTIYRALISDC